MGTQIQVRGYLQSAGFTLAEVVLALAVVAFGLIAVLGVLPIGLNTTRDNRYETMIVQDAEYWMNAIRCGQLGADSSSNEEILQSNVEWVQIGRVAGGVTTWYGAEFATVGTNGYAGILDHLVPPMPPPDRAAYIGQLKEMSWPKDVIGWLSAPDNGGSIIKQAKIRPLGGTHMNWLHGTRDDHGTFINEGHDLTFSYLLESHINPHPHNPDFCEIKLVFKWPITEEGVDPLTGKIKCVTGHGERTFVSYFHEQPRPSRASLGVMSGPGGGGSYCDIANHTLAPPELFLHLGPLVDYIRTLEEDGTPLPVLNPKDPVAVNIMKIISGSGELRDFLFDELRAGSTTHVELRPGVLFGDYPPPIWQIIIGIEVVEAVLFLASEGVLDPVGGGYSAFEPYDTFGIYSLKTLRGPTAYFDEMYFFKPPVEGD